MVSIKRYCMPPEHNLFTNSLLVLINMREQPFICGCSHDKQMLWYKIKQLFIEIQRIKNKQVYRYLSLSFPCYCFLDQHGCNIQLMDQGNFKIRGRLIHGIKTGDKSITSFSFIPFISTVYLTSILKSLSSNSNKRPINRYLHPLFLPDLK